MKILYIHQHFSTPDGAGTTRSYEFSKHLVGQGHQVTMLCGANKKANTGLCHEFKRGVRRGVVDGIEVIEINSPYSNHQGFFSRVKSFLMFSLRSLRFVITEKYDVIYASSTPLTVAIPALFAKFFRFKPYIFEVRDLWPDLPKALGVIKNKFFYSVLKKFERLTYKWASHCIGLSPGMCEGIIGSGVPKEKVTMIPNGCDMAFFSDRSGFEKVQILWRKQFDSDDFVAVFTGAHGYANGLDSVLDMAKVLMMQHHDNIKILFVGDGKLKSNLIKKVESNHLVNCIFWNPMPKTQLRHVLKLANVGLMVLKNIPEFYTGTSPNKFFDYLASGLPVINNYPGWVAGLITEYQCGVAVSPDDPRVFAQSLVRLSQLSKAELMAMGDNARNLGQETFNRIKLASQFSGVVLSV